MSEDLYRQHEYAPAPSEIRKRMQRFLTTPTTHESFALIGIDAVRDFMNLKGSFGVTLRSDLRHGLRWRLLVIFGSLAARLSQPGSEHNPEREKRERALLEEINAIRRKHIAPHLAAQPNGNGTPPAPPPPPRPPAEPPPPLPNVVNFTDRLATPDDGEPLPPAA